MSSLPLHEQDDRALLRAHVEGDPDAFGELFRRHRDRMWAVALRTTRNRELASDCVQDAFISAFRRAGSYRGDAAVTTWLHRIVVNACLDRLRRDKPTSELPEHELADRHDAHVLRRHPPRRPGGPRPAPGGPADGAHPRRHARPVGRRGGRGARGRRGHREVAVQPRAVMPWPRCCGNHRGSRDVVHMSPPPCPPRQPRDPETGTHRLEEVVVSTPPVPPADSGVPPRDAPQPAAGPARRHRARPHRHPRPAVRAARPRPDARRPGRPHQRLDRRRSSPRAQGGTVVPLRRRRWGWQHLGAAAAAAVVLAVGIPALLTGTGPGDVMASLGGGSSADSASSAGAPEAQSGRPAGARSGGAPADADGTVAPRSQPSSSGDLRVRGSVGDVALAATGTAYTTDGLATQAATLATTFDASSAAKDAAVARRRGRAARLPHRARGAGLAPGPRRRRDPRRRARRDRPRDRRQQPGPCMPCRPTATPQHPTPARRPAHAALSRRPRVGPRASRRCGSAGNIEALRSVEESGTVCSGAPPSRPQGAVTA